MQNNYLCENCGESSSVKLVKNSETNLYGCPRCHCKYSLDINKMIRVSQFGGQLPRPNGFGPGSSPVFNGTSTKSRGVNIRFESSIDSVISRTHNPAPIDPERNFEKRLEQFHTQNENDNINYDLTPKQRQKLKLRKEIRRREKFYEEAANRVDQNAVHYINENFKPKDEHLMTREEALSARRKYENLEPKSIVDDLSPEQMKPERRHSLAKVKHGLTTVFDNPTTEVDNNYNPGLLNYWPMVGNYGGSFRNQEELKNYLSNNSDLLINKVKGFDDFTNNNTNSFTFPLPEESYGSFSMPSNLPSTVKKYNFDPNNTSLEEGLESLLDPNSPDNLPQITVQDVNIDKYKLQGKEPNGVFEKYPASPAGLVGITPMPKNSLK